MHADARDVPRVGEADVLPGLSGIERLPHAVAMGDVAAHGLLTGADVNDVGIGLGDGDRADGPAEEPVGDRLPALAAVSGLPDPAAGRAEVVDAGLRRDPLDGRGTAAPIRPDLAPLHGLVLRRIEGGA